MSTDRGRAAHAIVATFSAGRGRSAWRLDRGAVADRLHELIADPGLVRQGGLNLCGPAALFTVWLRRDPVAAVTYAVSLFESGRAGLGALEVAASDGLRDYWFAGSPHAQRCPSADWMMMAALRDSTNRVLRYSRPGGVREAAAAITMPGTLRSWLTATGAFSTVRDETNLVLRKGMPHAAGLAPGPRREVAALVALEMFRRPDAWARRARDMVVALVPNHWVLLREPIGEVRPGRVGLRFWSWGEEQRVDISTARLRRCYFGALIAEGWPETN